MQPVEWDKSNLELSLKTKFVSCRNVEGNCNAQSSTFYQISIASRSHLI